MASSIINIEKIVEDMKRSVTNPTLLQWLSEPPLSLEEARAIVAAHRSSVTSNEQGDTETSSSNGQK